MARKGDFLLEVRCEEIPARMLQPAIEQLSTRVFEGLMGRSMGPAKVETGFTPRRLVLVMSGIPDHEPDSEELVTGPPVSVAYDADGQPTPAAAGFAKRCGVVAAELQRIETERGEYVGVRRRVEGQPASAVLAELVPRVLRELSWAKTMRWGAGEGPWVRPVHGLLALYKSAVVPMSLFGIEAGNRTCGHPTLSPQSWAVRGPKEYRKRLAELGIEVSFEERRTTLRRTMEDLAIQHGGRLVEDPELLDKLASICEIPGVMEGRFDRALLALPREVLVTSLRDHQSAFTVEKDGELLPLFLTVMDRSDDPSGRVRAGNEWVVAARLADGRFFYDEDRKTALVERSRDLENLTFHVDLGSYAAKGERLAVLAERICRELGWGDEIEGSATASRLLKADLTTEMVKEFTSLQGVMGGLYAREEGYPEGVWQAIYDQYLPAAVTDEIPRGRLGQVCTLADRIDTLAGIFGLGLIPTGSKDPFGLRRAAQGVLRVLLEGDLALDWELVAAAAVRGYDESLTRGVEEILANLRPFLHDRIRYLLGRDGFSYDEIEAAIGGGTSNLPDLRSRVEALHQARDDDDFLSIVLAAKRIANIVKGAPEHELEPALLEEPAETDLHTALLALKVEVDEAVEGRDYPRALRAVASLAEVLDRFFVEVLVMAEDPAVKRNRLALLQEIQRTVSRTANLTEIVVEKAEYR